MAKRSEFYTAVCSNAGPALSGVEATIYDIGTLNTATVHEQRSGGPASANPITTGSDGVVNFWANPGAYDVALHDPFGRVSDHTISFDSLSGDTAGIDGARIEDNGLAALQIATDGVAASEIATDAVGYAERAAPTIISNTLVSDVPLVGEDTYNNGPTITLNQGAGVYFLWGSLELYNTQSAPSAQWIFTSRLIKYGETTELTGQRSRHYVGSNAGFGVTHSYFWVHTSSVNNEVILSQAKDNYGGASWIESDRSVLSGFRFA